MDNSLHEMMNRLKNKKFISDKDINQLINTPVNEGERIHKIYLVIFNIANKKKYDMNLIKSLLKENFCEKTKSLSFYLLKAILKIHRNQYMHRFQTTSLLLELSNLSINKKIALMPFFPIPIENEETKYILERFQPDKRINSQYSFHLSLEGIKEIINHDINVFNTILPHLYIVDPKTIKFILDLNINYSQVLINSPYCLLKYQIIQSNPNLKPKVKMFSNNASLCKGYFKIIKTNPQFKFKILEHMDLLPYKNTLNPSISFFHSDKNLDILNYNLRDFCQKYFKCSGKSLIPLAIKSSFLLYNNKIFYKSKIEHLPKASRKTLKINTHRFRVDLLPLCLIEMCAKKGIKYDHCLSLLKKFLSIRNHKESRETYNLLREAVRVADFLPKTIALKIVNKVFIEDPDLENLRLLKDSRRLMRQFSFSIYCKKIKNFHQLHDLAIQISNTIKIKDNKQLNQTLILPPSMAGLNVFIPQDTKDLVNIGSYLNNCVASYAPSIIRNRSQVFALKNNETYVACIELRNNKIVQAKGKFNKTLDSELYDEIKQIIDNKILTHPIKQSKSI